MDLIIKINCNEIIDSNLIIVVKGKKIKTNNIVEIF